MMNREETSDSIPTDLIMEILSRLPAKSIARFCCVSKLWGSMLHRPYFTELFLTRSRVRPRILLAVVNFSGVWRFYSLPQPQNLVYEKSSSLVVAADFHMNFSCSRSLSSSCGYASGLICFIDQRISKKHYDNKPVICNPSTRQYALLPKLTRSQTSSGHLGMRPIDKDFLGFDPIDKQFKVLSMGCPDGDVRYDHSILTLGTKKMRWKKIHCPLAHRPLSNGICINGLLYYVGGHDESNMMVCFDVRFETFKFIHSNGDWSYHSNGDWYHYNGHCSTKLINYKGKLCMTWLEYDIELHLLVLEDAAKQWSKYVYTLPQTANLCKISILGVTATGEIVYSGNSHVDMDYTSKQSLYVFYFNPERNTLQRVEIQGLDEIDDLDYVYAFVDHVEDLNVNDAKLLKSSQDLKIIRKWLKPHQRDSAPL